MELRHCVVGPWAVNAYVLVCPTTAQSVLIDPGAEPCALERLLDGTTPTAILATHSHPDHIGGLAEMRRRLSVPVLAHAGLSEQSGVHADVHLKGGERLPLGDSHLTVTSAPGHTDDQLCFGDEAGHHMIVGDAVFDGGPGKTWSVENFKTTLVTLRRIVLAWPDDTMCCPGHGSHFRLGDIRAAVERFLAKNHGNFYGDATWKL